jgi:hypothetical protein
VFPPDPPAPVVPAPPAPDPPAPIVPSAPPPSDLIGFDPQLTAAATATVASAKVAVRLHQDII